MVANSDQPWREIVDFVQSRGYDDFLGRKKSLTRETELFRDLKITGDDAIDFLSEFTEIFSMHVGDFNFHDYFEEEGFWPFRGSEKTKERRKITLGMLEQAARSGVWKGMELEPGEGHIRS